MQNITAPETLTILKVHGCNGNLKINKSDIFTVLLMESNVTQKIKCERKGIVNFKCSEGDIKQKNEILCVLSPCSHDIVVSGICGLCSAPVEIKNCGNGDIKCSESSRFAMLHSNKNVVVKKEAAIEISLKDYVGLLKKRKLSLLVDLDATILHSTDKHVSSKIKDVFHYKMRSDQNSSILLNYHTKFRPYLKQFLTEMNTFYEMHIYTFGNKLYAEKIAEIIDPDRTFFGSRIISKDDSFDPMKKSANLKSLFPRGDNMVCIIDDRTDVWNNAPNCIHVQPYNFFPETGDINDPHKTKDLSNLTCQENELTEKVNQIDVETKSENENPSHIQNNDDKKVDVEVKDNNESNLPTSNSSNKTEEEIKGNEIETKTENCETPNNQTEELDCYLISLSNILKEIHKNFYSEIDKLLEKQSVMDIMKSNDLPDVKEIMRNMRMNILKGCRVNFSGIIPLNQKVKDSYEYRMLTSLGAQYLHNVSLPSLRSKPEFDVSEEYTTHLICKSEGTKKMKQVAHYITEINRLLTEKSEKLSKSIHKVHLVKHDWLWQSYFFWQKVNESDFLFLPNMKQLAIPEGYSELIYKDPVNKIPTPTVSRKRNCLSIEEGCSLAKISRVDDTYTHDVISEERLKELDGIDYESLSGISTDSFEDSVDSYNDKDVPFDNLILHYSLQEQMEMLNEVDEAIDEEKCEKLKSPVSSDYYNTDSSVSSDISDESEDFKKPPKNWEKKEVSDESNSDDDNILDYGDCEETCNVFGFTKDNLKSDFDDVFDDCNF